MSNPPKNTKASARQGTNEARACLARGGTRNDLIAMAEAADDQGDVTYADAVNDVRAQAFDH